MISGVVKPYLLACQVVTYHPILLKRYYSSLQDTLLVIAVGYKYIRLLMYVEEPGYV